MAETHPDCHGSGNLPWSTWLDISTLATPQPWLASPVVQAPETRQHLANSNEPINSFDITMSATMANAENTGSSDIPPMEHCMQIFDSNIRPKSRRPRRLSTSNEMGNLQRLRTSSGACQKHKIGKRKVRCACHFHQVALLIQFRQCTCHSTSTTRKVRRAKRPSPSASNDSDSVIGHRGAHLEHDRGSLTNVQAPGELLVFTCPFVDRLCFFQTCDMSEFNIHCQEHGSL